MYANLQDLKECLSFSSIALPPGYRTILANILTKYGVSLNVENYEPADVWEIAMNLQHKLSEKIKKYENNLKELKELLYEMEEALVFTKIVNVNSMVFSEIGYLLDDREFAAFCDKVADRMIITNYSEHMVSWRSNTEKDLNTVQDSRTFRKACADFIARAIGEYSMVHNSETFNRNKNLVLNKYYRIAEDTSFLGLAASTDIYDALKKCDYVHALKLCHNTKINAAQLGEKCEALVKTAQENINDFYKKTKELCTLKDNSFYFVLAGFLIEELDQTQVYKFDTKHIPKRQNNETLAQYIERVQKSSDLETIESSKFFYEIHKDLITIMLVSNACKLDMKSFVNTAFMSSTLNLVVNTMNYVNVCQLFKISEDVYSMFEGQVYESNLFLKDGKWFTALEYYNGSEDLAASLALKSKEFDKAIRADVRDTIDLSGTVSDYLDGLYVELEAMSAANKPLVLLNKGETIDADNLLTDYDAFTIVNYLRDFLEVT